MVRAFENCSHIVKATGRRQAPLPKIVALDAFTGKENDRRQLPQNVTVAAARA
jgi:hypothetical protein